MPAPPPPGAPAAGGFSPAATAAAGLLASFLFPAGGGGGGSAGDYAGDYAGEEVPRLDTLTSTSNYSYMNNNSINSVNSINSNGSSAAGSTPQCHTLEFTGKGAGTTILIQFILFTVCVSTLLVKYWCESQPRRPCCVWFWDVSKQGFGAAFMHLLNLILAGVLSESSAGDVADPCAWYFVNISIDTFVGCFLQFFLLETVERFAASGGGRGGRCACLARSGFYGDPPRMSWWAGQLSVYCALVGLNKCFIFIFVYLGRAPLGEFARWLFSPWQGLPTVELVIVMILAPGIVNAWMFWVTDTFIMRMVKPGGNRYPAWCCCLCRRVKQKLCEHEGRGGGAGGVGARGLLDDTVGEMLDEESLPRSLGNSFSGTNSSLDAFYSAPMLDPAEMGAVGREARDSLEGGRAGDGVG